MRALFTDLKTYRPYLRRGALAAFAVSASALFFMIAVMLTDEMLLAVFALVVFALTTQYAGRYLFPERSERWVIYILTPLVLMWAGVFGVVFATFKPPFAMIIVFALSLQMLGTVGIAICFSVYRLTLRYLSWVETQVQRRRSLSEA